MKSEKGATVVQSMTPNPKVRRIVPIVLGVAMLAVILAAALTPNVGVVQALTPAQYGQPASTSGTSIYVYLGIVALLIVAALIAALLLVRRRRKPPATGTQPVEAWKGGPGAGSPPSGASTPPPPPTTSPAYLESIGPVGHGPSAPASYVETPADVGHAMPVAGPTVSVAAGTGAAAGAAAGEPEPDIDSLMTELDNISAEVMKKSTKKATAPPED